MQKKQQTFTSDACGGQTQNKLMSALCLHTIKTFPNLEQIDHIFMVSGQSHMEVDSMHALIENKSNTLSVCFFMTVQNCNFLTIFLKSHRNMNEQICVRRNLN